MTIAITDHSLPPALEGAQANAHLAAGADQARTRGVSKETVLKDVILGSQPTKRFVTTDELTGIFLYLVSDLGASANGASFSIDGGWTAQ